VVQIGTPHIGCRQSWHARGVKRESLPAYLMLGESAGAGIVGAPNMIDRHGTIENALAAISDEGDSE
jgi:hypothetical protein